MYIYFKCQTKMKGRIPYNIDIELLVRDLKRKNGKQLRSDYKQRLKEGMVYFITLLTFDKYEKKKRKKGYRLLNNGILEKIIGTRIPTHIRKILQENGIIEILPHEIGVHSTGYRLTQKYHTDDFINIGYSERISTKIKLYNNQVDEEEINNEDFTSKIYDVPEYPYLDEQFVKNNLKLKTFDSYQNLRELLFTLVNRTQRKRKNKIETYVTLLNLIGGYKGTLEDIKNEKYKPNLSPSNCRYYTTIVGLKRELRKFLSVNGEELVEVDIKSSQPFILSTILNRNFSTSTEDGYNVHTIYPELYDNFKISEKFSPHSEDKTEYVSGVWFTPNSLENLQNFTNYNFHEDFYNYILNNGSLEYYNEKRNKKLNGMTRSDIKDFIMNYLFDRNELNKLNNLKGELINSLFPELWDVIGQFHRFYTKTTFSYLLQRTESYLVLNRVCGHINENYPRIPFFTIHDSVLTTPKYSEIVRV